jgi:hypothetical protein
MHQAHRFRHGADLEKMIEREVIGLAHKHPRGFAIRLHVLGDFYSVGYVNLWAKMLNEHPQLHAFGFSARWDYGRDAVARALIELVEKNWGRFAIRFSNAPIEELATVSIEHPFQKPDDAIICPQQLGKTECCSTCALCWQSRRRIAFIRHEHHSQKMGHVSALQGPFTALDKVASRVARRLCICALAAC